MRVYLPATPALLRDWDRAGAAAPVGDRVFTVTPRLREAYAEGGEEELEWVAQTDAARACLDLLAADPTAAPLRILIAADLSDRQVAPDPAAGVRGSGVSAAAARSLAPVPRTSWAAVLADDPGDRAAQRTVALAAEVVRQAGAAALDHDDRIDDAEAVELGWYGVQEIPALLAAAVNPGPDRPGVGGG